MKYTKHLTRQRVELGTSTETIKGKQIHVESIKTQNSSNHLLLTPALNCCTFTLFTHIIYYTAITTLFRSKQRCATYHLADFEGHFVLSQSVCRTFPTVRSGNHDVAVPAQCSSSDRFDVLLARSFVWASFFSSRDIGQVHFSNMK